MARKVSGFTLMELLIVMLIIAVLAALSLAALQGTAEEARADRTRSIIAKLDQLVMQRWDSYRTRPLPMRVPPGTSPQVAAGFRLAGVRDIMRMELPDRKTDLIDPPADIDPRAGQFYYLTQPSLHRTYQRKVMVATGGVPANWTEVSQGAECLYLIVSTMHDGDKNALDFFMPGEIGDTDGDGMREILDGWGRPIEFLRWAPGYTEANGAVTNQSPPQADPFDPLQLDATPTALIPLIFSGGPDKSLDIFTDNSAPVPFHRYCPPGVDNNYPNPHAPIATGVIGTPQDTDGDGPEWSDNITNHWQPTNRP